MVIENRMRIGSLLAMKAHAQDEVLGDQIGSLIGCNELRITDRRDAILAGTTVEDFVLRY